MSFPLISIFHNWCLVSTRRQKFLTTSPLCVSFTSFNLTCIPIEHGSQVTRLMQLLVMAPQGNRLVVLDLAIPQWHPSLRKQKSGSLSDCSD